LTTFPITLKLHNYSQIETLGFTEAEVTMAQTIPSRPLIGITCELGDGDTFRLHRAYAEAIESAGGVPVHIPLIPRRSYLDAVMSRLDGLVISGSQSDLDPDYYGDEPLPLLGAVVPERDRTDMILLDIAEETAKPLLAICFGMQSLNVSRGGSLIQDIGSQISNPLKHEQGARADRPSHYVLLEPGSLLAALAYGDSVKVNSTHHQAIARLGADLRVTARASDGVIEAVEDTRPGRFVVGVQWHPEAGFADDTFSQSIFRRLIEATLIKRELDDVAGI
jgi:putative glutamine amidotransferase